MLSSQLEKLSIRLQSQVNTMLSDRGLQSLATPNDVEPVFQRQKQILRFYMDDPLWPTFKFPLTANEEKRLASRLKLHLAQLDAPFDELSVKLRYGGISAELKKESLREISRVTEQLLPEAAFLRRPPYPGVECRYRRGFGFTALMAIPLYKEGERPKEKFRAMKYFHLGHRLEEIVKRERELTLAPKQGPPADPLKQETTDNESETAEDP